MDKFKPNEWHYYPRQAEYYETWMYVIKANGRLNSIIFWFSGSEVPVNLFLRVADNECPIERWDPQRATNDSLRKLIKLTFNVKIMDSRKR